jgi:hypothetical protein
MGNGVEEMSDWLEIGIELSRACFFFIDEELAC